MTDGKWGLFVKNDTHNHRTTSAGAHPLLRRLTPYTTGVIENEARRQLPVYKTLNELRAQDPDLVIDKRDIYNARLRVANISYKAKPLYKVYLKRSEVNLSGTAMAFTINGIDWSCFGFGTVKANDS